MLKGLRELKGYKLETVVIIAVSLVLLAVRFLGPLLWPATGQYNLVEQTETVFWTICRLVIYSLAAWIGLRVTAPRSYNWLKHEIIGRFDQLTDDEKTSLSTRLFLSFLFALCLLNLSGQSRPSSSPLEGVSAGTYSPRDCVSEAIKADVGVREATGRNDGPEVERYLAHVGLGKGYAWCAAFVSYHLSACGIPNPKSAWSPAYSAAAKRVWTPREASRPPLPGDVFSIYYPSLKRVGHVGFVTGIDGRYITTIEGNTSGPGSREGDGVYARRRELSKVYCITNYIKDVQDRTDRTGPARAWLQNKEGRHLAHHRKAGVANDHGAGGHPIAGAAGTCNSNLIATTRRGGSAADLKAAWTGSEHSGQYGRGAHRRMHLRQLCHKSEGVEQVREGAGNEGGHKDQGGCEVSGPLVDMGDRHLDNPVDPLARHRAVEAARTHLDNALKTSI